MRREEGEEGYIEGEELGLLKVIKPEQEYLIGLYTVLPLLFLPARAAHSPASGAGCRGPPQAPQWPPATGLPRRQPA